MMIGKPTTPATTAASSAGQLHQNVALAGSHLACTGQCGKGWRDPDAEYDAMRDEK